MKLISTNKQKEVNKYVDRICTNANIISDMVDLMDTEKSKKMVDMNLKMIKVLADQIVTYSKRLR